MTKHVFVHIDVLFMLHKDIMLNTMPKGFLVPSNDFFGKVLVLSYQLPGQMKFIAQLTIDFGSVASYVYVYYCPLSSWLTRRPSFPFSREVVLQREIVYKSFC